MDGKALKWIFDTVSTIRTKYDIGGECPGEVPVYGCKGRGWSTKIHRIPTAINAWFAKDDLSDR